MTLFEIESAAAALLERPVNDLIVNDVDLGVIALNHVRRLAEQTNDFGFTRKLLTVSVNGVTGGSLDLAVEYGTTTPVIDIKTIVDVGLFDTDGNFCPVEWTSVSDSLNRQRQDNPRYGIRFPTDGQAVSSPIGWRRFAFAGNKVFLFPQTPNTTFSLGIIAYTFTPDWTDDDSDPDPNPPLTGPWLTHGANYLQWATVIHLNHLFKGFVFRQEGNLPPPEKIRDEALAALITWDAFKFEQFRRHSR